MKFGELFIEGIERVVSQKSASQTLNPKFNHFLFNGAGVLENFRISVNSKTVKISLKMDGVELINIDAETLYTYSLTDSTKTDLLFVSKYDADNNVYTICMNQDIIFTNQCVIDLDDSANNTEITLLNFRTQWLKVYDTKKFVQSYNAAQSGRITPVSENAEVKV